MTDFMSDTKNLDPKGEGVHTYSLSTQKAETGG